jgi:hypothetical protein
MYVVRYFNSIIQGKVTINVHFSPSFEKKRENVGKKTRNAEKQKRGSFIQVPYYFRKGGGGRKSTISIP